MEIVPTTVDEELRESFCVGTIIVFLAKADQNERFCDTIVGGSHRTGASVGQVRGNGHIPGRHRRTPVEGGGGRPAEKLRLIVDHRWSVHGLGGRQECPL